MDYGSKEFPATDFAITTVNVPDRLDLRDMDDRNQVEEETRRRRFDLSVLLSWGPRLVVIGFLTLIALALWEGFDAWRNALSAGQIAQRLTTALGVPVRVDNSQFAFSPTPRLQLTNVSIDNKLILNDVSINLGTRHIAQVFEGKGWNWGEAVVGPSSLTLDQCRVLLNLLPKLDGALPHSLSSVRFDHLQIADQPWFSGNWEVGTTHTGNAGFTMATAVSHSEKGYIEIQINPSSDPSTVSFQIDGHNWVLPFGPKFPVDEIVANGTAASDRVELTDYSVGGQFGAVKGNFLATQDANLNWKLEGALQSESLDLAGLLHLLAPTTDASDAADDTTTMMQGTAAFQGRVAGRGRTLVESVDNSLFEAPVTVRSPILNGINLGYAASRLQKDFFHRWMRYPTRFDPATRMTKFTSDDGTTPLKDILGGKADDQFEAVWQYLVEVGKMNDFPH